MCSAKRPPTPTSGGSAKQRPQQAGALPNDHPPRQEGAPPNNHPDKRGLCALKARGQRSHRLRTPLCLKRLDPEQPRTKTSAPLLYLCCQASRSPHRQRRAGGAVPALTAAQEQGAQQRGRSRQRPRPHPPEMPLPRPEHGPFSGPAVNGEHLPFLALLVLRNPRQLLVVLPSSFLQKPVLSQR